MSGAPAAHRLTAERVKLLAGTVRIVSASAKPQMKVPFLDLKAHHAPLIDQFDRAIREVIESSAFAGGPFVERFEEEFAAYCGSEVRHRRGQWHRRALAHSPGAWDRAGR